MSIQDHLAIPNLAGFNPLLGPARPNYPRFVPLSTAYSRSLRRLVFLAAHALGLPRAALAESTYAWVSGPSYETPAEMIRHSSLKECSLNRRSSNAVTPRKRESVEKKLLCI